MVSSFADGAAIGLVRQQNQQCGMGPHNREQGNESARVTATSEAE